MTMLLSVFGILIGTALGALGGPLVATLGAVFGLVAGMLLANVVNNVRRVRTGHTTAPDAQHILCVPKGQVATTTFVRDAETGEWLDVAACSLCTPANEVNCQKNCLVLVRDSVPRTAPFANARPVAGAAT